MRVVRVVDSLELEYRVATLDEQSLIRFRSAQVTDGVHYIAPGASRALEIGVLPSTLMQAAAAVLVQSSVGERAIAVAAQGGRFSCEVESDLSFGEVSIRARIARSLTLANTGHLPATFTITLSQSLRQSMVVLAVTKKPAVGAAAAGAEVKVVVPSAAAAPAPAKSKAEAKRPGQQAQAAVEKPAPRVQLAPGESAEVRVEFYSELDCAVNGEITFEPDIAGADPHVCTVSAEARSLHILLSDSAPLDVGKVIPVEAASD